MSFRSGLRLARSCISSRLGRRRHLCSFFIWCGVVWHGVAWWDICRLCHTLVWEPICSLLCSSCWTLPLSLSPQGRLLHILISPVPGPASALHGWITGTVVLPPVLKSSGLLLAPKNSGGRACGLRLRLASCDLALAGPLSSLWCIPERFLSPGSGTTLRLSQILKFFNE